MSTTTVTVLCVCVHNMQATPVSTIQAAPCGAHAVTSQSVQYSHCTTQEDVWIGPHCVCVHLCSLLLTTGMATVGLPEPRPGPYPLTLIDRGVEGLWVVPAPCESLPSSVQATASGAMPVAANAGSSRKGRTGYCHR